MPKDAALAALSEYNVVTLKERDRMTITTKPVLRDGINYLRFLGSITFRNSVVAEVSRSWGESESGREVQGLWKSIWGAVTNSIPDSTRYTPVSVRAYTTATPQGQWKALDILVTSNRRVSINWSDVDTSGIVISPTVHTLSFVSIEETVF